MDQNGFSTFDDLINFCKNLYEQQEDNQEDSDENNQGNSRQYDNCKFGNSNANASEESRNANSDIPGGFQDIPPQLLLVIGELLGNVMAGNLPFNIQNVVGNWLQLVGQAIEVYNAQQQYYQGGPGRVYNPIYRNASNPFCPDGSDESQANISTSRKKTARSKERASSTISSDESIKELKSSIKELNNEIRELKKEIEKLKKKT